MNLPKTQQDKRAFPRIPKSVPIEITTITYPFPKKPDETGTGKDISGGGVCVITSHPYAPDALISLSIKLVGWWGYKRPHSLLVDIASEKPLIAVGKVVWCTPAEDAKSYETGIKFENIYEDDHRALMNYLKSFQ